MRYLILISILIIQLLWVVMPVESAAQTSDSSSVKQNYRNILSDSDNPLNPARNNEPGMGKLAIRAFFSLILVVLLLFALMFGLRWLQRHATPGGSQTGPTMQVCGALSLGPKKTLQIVQVGKQLLVLGVTDTSISLVTEITDADEIKELEKNPPKNRLASKPFSEYLARFKSK